MSVVSAQIASYRKQPYLIFPDATPQQILGSKPVFWELNNTGRSLRKSQIILII
jgi:hypothetical protein